MWKWLHRGLVGVLVLVSTGAMVSELNIWNPVLDPMNEHSWIQYNLLQRCKLGCERRLVLYVTPDHVTGYFALGNIVDEAMPLNDLGFPGGELRFYRSAKGLYLDYYFQYWLLSSLFAIYPAIFFIRSYRRRRVNRQAVQPCGQCGYDLQGNESGVCPECGEAVEAVA